VPWLLAFTSATPVLPLAKLLVAMHLPADLGPTRPTPAPRGFAATVAELHPGRLPPQAAREGQEAEDPLN
jgi:hypothetical protein